jgi:hypothetical protein
MHDRRCDEFLAPGSVRTKQATISAKEIKLEGQGNRVIGVRVTVLFVTTTVFPPLNESAPWPELVIFQSLRLSLFYSLNLSFCHGVSEERPYWPCC